MREEPRGSAAFFLESEGSPPRAAVAVIGEIDFASRPELESCLKAALEGEVVSVEVDLSEVTFIDVSGIKPILDFQQECQDRGVECRVSSSPAVDRVMDLLEELGEAARLLIEDE
jgi:anti-anti-sigma factor